MLLGSPLRPRVVFYTAVIIILFIITRVLYTTPTDPRLLRFQHTLEDRLHEKLENRRLLRLQGTKATDGDSNANQGPQTHVTDSSKADTPQSDSSGSGSSGSDSSAQDWGSDWHATSSDDDLPCRNLPGAEDVVVIMRTGATEIQDKLPAHFNTTFRCYSDLIIFSDYAETFMGHEVHDVLVNVDPEVVKANEDFDIYLRLLYGGRASLREDELSGKLSFEGSKSGKLDNPGWRLDKWKFLPMMRETLNLRPDKKWYVFIESDSYIVWSNILRYVAHLNPDDAIYHGSEVQIGEDLFAHGGSAFVMSQSAVERAAVRYEEDLGGWHDWTGQHWAGDCILGMALTEAGVDLGWAWPMFQGGHPEKMDFTEEKGDVRIWCSPINSFHHFTSEELLRIWQFEQDWISVVQEVQEDDNDHRNDKRWQFLNDHPRDDSVLHGGDVFKAFVYPNLTDFREEWNSLSPDKVEGSEDWSVDECRKACEDDGSCLQYTHALDGCFTSPYAMLGQPWGDVQSGWFLDRIDQWVEDLDRCEGFKQGWTLDS